MARAGFNDPIEAMDLANGVRSRGDSIREYQSGRTERFIFISIPEN